MHKKVAYVPNGTHLTEIFMLSGECSSVAETCEKAHQLKLDVISSDNYVELTYRKENVFMRVVHYLVPPRSRLI